ncbi:MAG: hypothetical protein ACTSU5_11595 [Promethearchaeota archaeon]
MAIAMSAAAGVFALLITLKILARYMGKDKGSRNSATLFLVGGLFFWVAVCFLALTTYAVGTVDAGVAKRTNQVMYSCIILATMLTYLFAARVFFEPKNSWTAVYLAVGLAYILVFQVINPVTVEAIGTGGFVVVVLEDLYGILLVAYLVPTLVGIFLVAKRTARKMEDPVYKAGYKYIGWGQIAILLVLVMDTLASVFLDQQALYVSFLVLTWVWPIVSAYLQYLGWILPDWLRKRIEMSRG